LPSSRIGGGKHLSAPGRVPGGGLFLTSIGCFQRDLA